MGDARLGAIARGCGVQIIRMLTHAGSGHPGGSLSVIDLLVAIAFGGRTRDATIGVFTCRATSATITPTS